MESEFTLNPGELMSIDHQLDSTICISEGQDLSIGNRLKYRMFIFSCYEINFFLLVALQQSLLV
jgi:hypothetical protein